MTFLAVSFVAAVMAAAAYVFWQWQKAIATIENIKRDKEEWQERNEHINQIIEQDRVVHGNTDIDRLSEKLDAALLTKRDS